MEDFSKEYLNFLIDFAKKNGCDLMNLYYTDNCFFDLVFCFYVLGCISDSYDKFKDKKENDYND